MISTAPNHNKEKIAEDKALWQEPWFMWLCIIIGGITILFFVRSLVKDILDLTKKINR